MQNSSRKNDWILKSLAGIIFGFMIALYLSEAMMLLPLNIIASVKVQFAMWLVTPIWLSVLGFCYLFHTGKQAWGMLGMASASIFFTVKLINLLM